MADRIHGFFMKAFVVSGMPWLWLLGVATMTASNCVYGQPGHPVRLTEAAVACQPAGDWMYQFPAISQHRDQIAVLTATDPGTGIISLQVLRILDQGLGVELDFPLFELGHVDWKECIEDVEAGRRQGEVGSPEMIAEINAYLSDNEFIEMFPLEARRTYEVKMDSLPSEPEVVISWDHYHILTDYHRGKISISQVIKDGGQGPLAPAMVEAGDEYFELQLNRKKKPGVPKESETCVGIPVPVGIWTNQRWRESVGDRIFLLRIGFVSPEYCDFPDEWFAQVIE